ncbi:Uncharacterised protein [Mycobacteroides abscessus subsp. abscessus]|uniref:hypothetical protein n=1 Tax=Mycobacteroides abscessus TaxID=36809 RepID=UPI000927A59C|nr:hypothetical protein [Mycobacteroides abscessus]SIF35604.1 Uncharacterised protein [Mycobacteroides abscessus subsp. abscessus]
MRGNPSRARRRAARAVRQPSRMTDYQRHRQAEQLHGVDKIRDYLHDIELDISPDVLNELIEDEDGAPLPPCTVCGVTHHHADTEPVREPNAYELAILGALQHKSVYQGSVPVDDIRRRRLRNRDSKRARRLQRRSKVRRMRRRHQSAAGNAAAFALFMLTSAFIGAVTMLASPGWWIA